MDNTEVHYLTYDPEEAFTEMQLAYIEAGGDVLYPGDEKEMLLRGVQAMIVQVMAGVDNALRMSTLRYAVGDYLDLYGEKRGCTRLLAQAATAQVTINMAANGEVGTIPAGTALTADGEIIYETTEELQHYGTAQSIITTIACSRAGSAGNGLQAGTQMQFLSGFRMVDSVYCTQDAKGGEERETDDAYRERIRAFGISSPTTGPARQYESAAKAVSSEILDANAVNLGAGKVGVYLLLASETGASGIIAAVQEALSADTVRPLTDEVVVTMAQKVPYDLKVKYTASADSQTSNALAAAVAEYSAWQDRTLQRAFNPEMLMALLYQAGATRVVFDPESTFNGGHVIEYTDIGSSQYCSGTVSLAVME